MIEPRSEIQKYFKKLAASGMDEREVFRAVFYANHYGLEAMERDDDCLVFDKPTCGDWNCLNPEHQVFA